MLRQMCKLIPGGKHGSDNDPRMSSLDRKEHPTSGQSTGQTDYSGTREE